MVKNRFIIFVFFRSNPRVRFQPRTNMDVVDQDFFDIFFQMILDVQVSITMTLMFCVYTY